jgi:signal transduction histidine kinase
MKDEFISTVSHELRTPLTSLRAALGLVAGGALNARPEKMRQMMEIAIGNTDRLVRLVNDILDLERIGSGKAELHFTPTSVDDLFKRVTMQHQTTAQRANIRFHMEANNVVVWADPDRILQALNNLISNAIKFSPQASTIPSEIRLIAHYVTPDEALIEVEDHGRGIPTDKLQQIFDRFKQVDASDSRAMGGTGLGLAICRSIIQQHGGHVWATSTLGEGSVFHFTLPTKPSSHLG